MPEMADKNARYEALVTAYSGDLYRYARWLCRNPAMAEDLVQETFLRAWKSLASLRDDGAAKSWLKTILRREHARQYERYRPDFADDYDLDSVPGASTDEAEVLNMRHALDMLAEDYREPLVLQVVGGYSCQEIADIMGLSAGAVMTRVFRARRQLRSLFEEAAGTLGEGRDASEGGEQ